jgi:hypothetical protein
LRCNYGGVWNERLDPAIDQSSCSCHIDHNYSYHIDHTYNHDDPFYSSYIRKHNGDNHRTNLCCGHICDIYHIYGIYHGGRDIYGDRDIYHGGRDIYHGDRDTYHGDRDTYHVYDTYHIYDICHVCGICRVFCDKHIYVLSFHTCYICHDVCHVSYRKHIYALSCGKNRIFYVHGDTHGS